MPHMMHQARLVDARVDQVGEAQFCKGVGVLQDALVINEIAVVVQYQRTGALCRQAAGAPQVIVGHLLRLLT